MNARKRRGFGWPAVAALIALLSTTIVVTPAGAGEQPTTSDVTIPDEFADAVPGFDRAETDPFTGYLNDFPMRSFEFTAVGSYVPLAGDFDCRDTGGFPGMFFYAPGSAPDYLWTELVLEDGQVSPTSRPAPVSGTYQPFVGDFDSNGCSDIFWYAPGSGADYIWYFQNDGSISSKRTNVRGVYQPVPLAHGGAIYWWSPTGRDYLWIPTGDMTFQSFDFAQKNATSTTPIATINPALEVPAILWYTPGSAPDEIWNFTGAGLTIDELQDDGLLDTVARPVPLWARDIQYRPGAADDPFVIPVGEDGLTSQPNSVNGTYRTASMGVPTWETVVWHGPGAAKDFFWINDAYFADGWYDLAIGNDSDGFVDAETFRARQDDYIDYATQSLNSASSLNIINHITRDRRDPSYTADLSSVTPDVFADDFDDIANYVDTTDFDILYFLNLLYAGEDLLPADTVAAIDEALLGYEYWYTEPTPEGVIDNKYYWSENHRIIFAVDEYLMGQRHPDAIFTNDGRTGAEHMAGAKERIDQWLEEKIRFGFTEWHSDVYYQKDFTPLLALVEWADDPDLANRAGMMLDVFALDLALHLHDGNMGATHGRSYMKDKSKATQQDVFGLAKLLFADTEVEYVSTGDAGASLFARAEKYRLPAVIDRIARSDQPIIDKERMGVPLDNNAPFDSPPPAPYGVSFTDPANVDFWWERGAQTVFPVVPLTMDTLDLYGLWESDTYSAFIPLRDAFNGDRTLSSSFIAAVSEQIAFGFLPEVSTTTYRTDHVMLSTALDHRPGDHADQVHVWQATLAEDAIVFTTNPKNEPFIGETRFPDADGYWTGEGALPRSAQVGSTSISLYAPTFVAPPPGDTGPLAQFTYLPTTHAFFPTEKFDEVVVDAESGWVFGREGDGYVAIWSHRPAAFVDPVPADIFTNGLTAPFDLRADGGADNVWISEVGDVDSHGSFEAFRAAVAAAPISVVTRPVAGGLPGGFDVAYGSPSTGEIVFGQDGPLMVGGVEEPLRHDLRMDNPFTQVPFEGEVFDINDGVGSLLLDFAANTRTAD